MANTKLSALPLFNGNSLTNIGSMGFYADNAGNSRLLNGAAATAALGHPLGATAVRSTAFTLGVNITTVVSWEATDTDPLGYWDAASSTYLKMPYNGWVRIGAQWRGSEAYTNTIVDMRVFKNGLGFPGGPRHRYELDTNAIDQVWSPPLIVSSGDLFELYLVGNGGTREVGLFGKTWLAVQPIAIWLPE